MNGLYSSKATPVGAYAIQFYIPVDVATDSACLFDPTDPADLRVYPNTGLLLTPADDTPTVEDLLADVAPAAIDELPACILGSPVDDGVVLDDEHTDDTDDLNADVDASAANTSARTHQ